MTTPHHDQDIISMLSFSPEDWLSILAVWILIYLLYRFAMKKVYGIRNHDALWVVSMFFIDQDNIREITTFLQILTTCMSLFAFFVLNYLTNAVGSDLVSVDDPRSLEKYEDIMKHDVQPIFLKGHPAVDIFRHAAEGSIQKEVWNHAIKKTGNNCVLKPNMNKITELITDFLSQKLVLLANWGATVAGAQFICSQIRAEGSEFYHPELHLLMASDSRTDDGIVSMIYNPNLDPEIIRSLHKGISRSLEFGRDQVMSLRLRSVLVPWSPIFETCITFKTLKDTPDLPLVTISNMVYVIILFGLGILLGLIALMIEFRYRKIQIRNLKRKKQFIRRLTKGKVKLRDSRTRQAGSIEVAFEL